MENNKFEAYKEEFTNNEGEVIKVDAEVFHLDDTQTNQQLEEQLELLHGDLDSPDLSDKEIADIEGKINQINEELARRESVTPAA
jgi:hypothetical protein